MTVDAIRIPQDNIRERLMENGAETTIGGGGGGGGYSSSPSYSFVSCLFSSLCIYL